MYKHIKGLVAAPFTGFNADMSVNTVIVKKYAFMLRKAGVVGVFVNGSTGEGLSLTVSQRKQLAESWAAECDDNFKLLVHVGDVCVENCVELASHAQKLKAAAIGMMGPCYYKPASVDELVEFSAKVAAAASNTPYYYYHIPSMTGVSFMMGDYIRKAAVKIPNFVGVKYTHYDIMDFMDCCDYQDGKFDILYGRDETLLAGLAAGAGGAIGSTYNYIPAVYLEIIEAYGKGDMAKARKMQLKSIEIIKLLIKGGNSMGVGKAMMKLCGIDLGGCALPNKQIADSHFKQLEKDLKDAGFFDYCIKA